LPRTTSRGRIERQRKVEIERRVRTDRESFAKLLEKRRRARTVVEGDRFEVLVLEVNPHDY
jgi:hypothetical protein